MPGLSGEELVRRLVERKVQYPIIVTSGWPPTEQWVRKYADTDFNITFLHCPFELSELYKEINRQLGAKLQFQNRKPEQGLTKAQQAFMDEVFARAGNPSAAFQRQIDEIRAVKTEDELKILVRRDANVERPTIEAELLCVVYMAKLAELNPNINAEKLKEEQHEATT
jgi:DNA-binding NtrC family response regulator